MPPKISIIVPVYNTERYLQTCIDSILRQSFSDFELLLVDDGSTDSSGKICDDYANRDPRVTAIHKENGGVSSARNLGLEKACGEWIHFVDSDDTITDDCLETLYNGIEDNIDIVEGQYVRITEKGANPKCFDEQIDIISPEDYAVELFCHILYRYRCYPVTKIYRADLIRAHNLTFDTSVYYKEDGLFVAEYLCKMNGKVKYIHHLIYYYYIRDSSMVRIYNNALSEKSITELNAIIQMFYLVKEKYYSKELHKSAKNEITHVYLKLVNKIIKFRQFQFLKRVNKEYFGTVSFTFLCSYIVRKVYSKTLKTIFP